MGNNNKLQDKRKGEIPNLIEKYQKLVDNIFDAVSKQLPCFKDIINEETEEVISTSEQQLYSFISVRDRALDSANNILNKINYLERELNDPNFKVDEEEVVQETTKSKPTIKRYTKN